MISIKTIVIRALRSKPDMIPLVGGFDEYGGERF